METLAKEGHGTKRVCRLLGVASSGFFMWRSKPPSDRSIRRAWLTDTIGAIHVASRGTYGSRRVKAELADAFGQVVNKKLIVSIIRELGIAGLPSRRRRKRNLVQQVTTEDLVNRDFPRDGPNQLWMTDITEHPTREGKLYCCCVLDAWSRRSSVGPLTAVRPQRWSTPRSQWRLKPVDRLAEPQCTAITGRRLSSIGRGNTGLLDQE